MMTDPVEDAIKHVHQVLNDTISKSILGEYSEKTERHWVAEILRLMAEKVEKFESLKGFDMRWKVGSGNIDLTESYLPEHPASFIKIDVCLKEE